MLGAMVLGAGLLALAPLAAAQTSRASGQQSPATVHRPSHQHDAAVLLMVPSALETCMAIPWEPHRPAHVSVSSAVTPRSNGGHDTLADGQQSASTVHARSQAHAPEERTSSVGHDAGHIAAAAAAQTRASARRCMAGTTPAIKTELEKGEALDIRG